MSWLIGPSKKKAKPKKKAASNSTGVSWVLSLWGDPRLFIALKAALCLAGLAAVSATWLYGGQWLRRHVGQSQAEIPTVEINAPPWLPRDDVEQLRQRVQMIVDADPFERMTLEEAAAEVQANPWVRQAVRVARRPGGHVDVVAAFRQPVALVEKDNRYYLVDQHGVRLPKDYAPEAAQRLDLPIIVGVRGPTPDIAQPWGGGDLLAGLRLASLVSHQPWREQVRAVDVQNFAGRLWAGEAHLKLLTRDDEGKHLIQRAGVAWGRAPGEERFAEMQLEEKLARIEQVRLKYEGQIDGGGGILDVRLESRGISGREVDSSVRYTTGG